jgi:hypothetical protein
VWGRSHHKVWLRHRASQKAHASVTAASSTSSGGRSITLTYFLSFLTYIFPSSSFMADARDTISRSFERLRQSVSDEDAHVFASTELSDVWKAVREIDASQRKRQSAQNLRRVEPLLKGLEKYTKVIEVLCNGTPYLPYVWVCVRALLQPPRQTNCNNRHL